MVVLVAKHTRVATYVTAQLRMTWNIIGLWKHNRQMEKEREYGEQKKGGEVKIGNLYKIQRNGNRMIEDRPVRW